MSAAVATRGVAVSTLVEEGQLGVIARVHAPGSFALEICLWLFGIVPGIIYSLWRIGARRLICPRCGSWDLEPVNSRRARRLKDERVDQKKCQTEGHLAATAISKAREGGQRLLARISSLRKSRP
jgi:hypothetical protein